MKILEKRNDILDFLVDVEINPKNILKVNIKNEWLSKTLNSMLESYLLDVEYNRNDFNADLRIVEKNVRNKFN